MNRLHLTALVLIALAPRAGAQQVDCASAMTQVELNFCAEQAWLAADADLNAAYDTARSAMRDVDAALPAAQRGAETALRDAQRAWITFRDAACDAEAWRFAGGSAMPLALHGCLERLTRTRADDLAALSSLE